MTPTGSGPKPRLLKENGSRDPPTGPPGGRGGKNKLKSVFKYSWVMSTSRVAAILARVPTHEPHETIGEVASISPGRAINVHNTVVEHKNPLGGRLPCTRSEANKTQW